MERIFQYYDIIFSGPIAKAQIKCPFKTRIKVKLEKILELFPSPLNNKRRESRLYEIYFEVALNYIR